jgi:dienelactone hydrolase
MSVEFHKANGQVIRGKLFEPEGATKYPLVIFSHGFNGCYADLEHHGKVFADAGIGCLFFDFCGGGLRSTSDGSMTEMTVGSELEDLLTVFEQASVWEKVDKENVFLLGESQGGLVSAMAAAELKDRLKGLILWYPAFVIPDDSRKRLELPASECDTVFGLKLSPDFNRDAAEIDIKAVMKGYTGPVLILHGNRDEVVPVNYSLKAEKVYKDAQLVVFNMAMHGFVKEDSRKACFRSRDFVLQHKK